MCIKAFSGTWCAFLRDTCGITHTRQPAYQNIQNAQFDAGNIIVFPQTSKFKSYLLSSDAREGTVDVVAKGMAVLWSSLDRRARRSFNEDALYAYDVNAMRNICEESKVRKKWSVLRQDFLFLTGWEWDWCDLLTSTFCPVPPWLTRLADFT